MSKYKPQPEPAYRVEVSPEWGEQRWVQVPKTISRDVNLSTEAVGAVVRLVDNDSQFRFSHNFLARKFGWGINKTTKIIKELRAAGFLETHRDRDERGHFYGETVYTLYPTRRFPIEDGVSTGQNQDNGNHGPGHEQAKRDVSTGGDVSAGQNQDDGFHATGREQGKRDVSAGKTESHGFHATRIEQGKRDVSAGKTESHGNDQQTEPNQPNLKNPPPPGSSSGPVAVPTRKEEGEEFQSRVNPGPGRVDAAAVAASLLGVDAAGWRRLGKRQRENLELAVRRLIGEGAHPDALPVAVLAAGPIDGPDVKSPAAVLLYRLDDLDASALTEPPRAAVRPSEGKSEGSTTSFAASCGRGPECRGGQLVCDPGTCDPRCLGRHEPRGIQCPDCSRVGMAPAGPTFEQQLTDAIGTQPGLMDMDSRAA